MASGWEEFWKRIRKLAKEDRRDDGATWARFKKLSARSEQAALLEKLVLIGDQLPAREQYGLAVTIARLLAPVEWPPEWVAARTSLVTALGALLDETDPGDQLNLFGPALFAPDGAAAEDDDLRPAHAVLYAARDLFRRPCRRDELHAVALLCNTGIALCLRMYRRAATRFAAPGQSPSLDEVRLTRARSRFQTAFLAYAEAASAFNSVVGEVLFEGLHASLEEKH